MAPANWKDVAVELWIWRAVEGSHAVGGKRELLCITTPDRETLARLRDGYFADSPGRYRLEFRDDERIVVHVEGVRVRPPKPPPREMRRYPAPSALPMKPPTTPIIPRSTQAPGRPGATAAGDRGGARTRGSATKGARKGPPRPAEAPARRAVPQRTPAAEPHRVVRVFRDPPR